jgi:hypothetical protein
MLMISLKIFKGRQNISVMIQKYKGRKELKLLFVTSFKF